MRNSPHTTIGKYPCKLPGNFPSCLKLVQAWIEIHQEELLANWQLAVNGERPFRIESLCEKSLRADIL